MALRRKALLSAVGAALLTVGLATGLPTASAATGDGSPADPNISFVGRWDTTNAAAYVPAWAGAYLSSGFTGTTVKLKQRNTIDLYYSIDNGAFRYLTGVSGSVNLTPAKLASGKHTLRVSYRVVAGSYHGDAVFQGLTLDPGAITYAVKTPPKLIEFIGDSITVGTTTSENALTAYGWLIGERLGTRHTQIAQGGACLVTTADGCVGMEDYFLKLNSLTTSATWDFSRYTANAVVINLGTNDLAHGTHTTTFQPHYLHLLEEVRAKYPNAAIFAMRTFAGRFGAQTEAAVQTRNAAGDAKVYYVDTTGWLTSTDFTDGTHPTDAGHVKVADKLAPLISAKL
jgi:lysophospholipase L1-like esterase